MELELCPDEGRENYGKSSVHQFVIPGKATSRRVPKPKNPVVVEISNGDIAEMIIETTDTPGYCEVCGDRTDDVEPDLRDGDCPVCGEKGCVKSALVWLGIN